MVSLLITVVVYVLMPDPERFNVELTGSSYKGDSTVEVYHDLNTDGNAEKIQFLHDVTGLCSYIIYDDEVIIDQWVMKGTYIRIGFYGFLDYDNDKLKEVYTLAQSNDSVFLSVIEPVSGEILLRNLYLTKTNVVNSAIDTPCMGMQLIESDATINKELLINFFAGFSKFPRKMVVVDIDDGTFNSTPSLPVNIREAKLYDVDDDGKDEIFGFSLSLGNFKEDKYLTDQYIWLYFYDDDLSFYFEPKQVGVYPGNFHVFPFQDKNETYLISVYNHSGLNDSCWIAKYTLDGELIKRVYNKGFSSGIYPFYETGEPYFYTLQHDGRVYKIDYDLNVLEEKQFFKNGLLYDEGSLMLSGKKYRMFRTRDGLFYIADAGFAFYQQLPLHFEKAPFHISVTGNETHKQLVLSHANKVSFYSLEKNWFYEFRFLFYFLMFGALWGVFYLFTWVGRKRLEQTYRSQQKIAELQVKTMRGQLDPHFTLNLINSIGGLFTTQKVDEANRYFGKYAKMLREIIISSDKVEVPLEEELEFCENYLSLEQFRMNHKFSFVIAKVDEDIANVSVPRLLIHSFVENAVKHGIKHLKEREGFIHVEVESGGKGIQVKITDNGIGRRESAKHSFQSTGRGMSIIDETLKNYNFLQRGNITYHVVDLEDENGNPNGTKVEVTIKPGGKIKRG